MLSTRHFLYELPSHLGTRLGFLPPLLARVCAGYVFAATGWGKLQNIDQVVAFFTELGIPFPGLQAPFVAFTELSCGTLILLGLATRVAALPLIATMVVAVATAQWPQVDSAAALFGLVETLYVLLFAWLAAAGPGPVSLDALVERALGIRESENLPVHALALRPHARA